MRTLRTGLLAVAFLAASVVLAAPAHSGQNTMLSVSGTATCISETEVSIYWSALNTGSGDAEILGGLLISHGSQMVDVLPSPIGPGGYAYGTTVVPSGPGTAVLEVHFLPGSGGNSIDTRQSFLVQQGSVAIPDCRQATTTTTLATTTTVGQTTTTVAPAAAPITQAPTYTG